MKDKKLCPNRSHATATQTLPDVCRAERARVLARFSTENIFWNLRQQHRRLSVSRVPKLNTTQQSRQQLRELVVFQWCATRSWQSQPRNWAECNGRASHCNAKRCWTYQTCRNPDAMVATSLDQWRHQDDSSWWKWQLCRRGNKTFGLPDHEQTLEVLWNAFCRRPKPDCTPAGTLFGDWF